MCLLFEGSTGIRDTIFSPKIFRIILENRKKSPMASGTCWMLEISTPSMPKNHLKSMLTQMNKCMGTKSWICILGKISGVLKLKVCVISRPFDAAPPNFGWYLGVPFRFRQYRYSTGTPEFRYRYNALCTSFEMAWPEDSKTKDLHYMNSFWGMGTNYPTTQLPIVIPYKIQVIFTCSDFPLILLHCETFTS